MKTYIVGVLLGLAMASTVQANQIMAVDAKKVVGRDGLVCGTVAGFRFNENTEGAPGIFYFEKNFPSHEFSVRINRADLEKMPAISGKESTYVGKIMCAEGRVERGGGGRPEMRVTQQSKIKLGS